MAFSLSWRLLTVARLAERSRDPIRLLSVSSFFFAKKVVPFKLSDIGEGIRDVTVKEWFVKPGDQVKQFDDICEVQSDKASVTITSRYDGLIKTLHYKVDDVALVGSTLLDFEIEDDSTDAVRDDVGKTAKSTDNQTIDNSEKSERKSDKVESENITLKEEKILSTPAVRRIAKENNIKLTDVKATGKDGRVLKEDILAHLQQISADPRVKVNVPSNMTGRTVGLKGYTKHMWKTMTKSLTIPHFVYSDECNVDEVMRCRNNMKDSLIERGISLTLMPFFIKAASRALEQYPRLNAWLDEEAQQLQLLDNHNIGIAMDTPDGLVVPNIKNVQNLSVFAIAQELNRLQECGSKASILYADASYTTFTLSNIGMIGGTYTKPVIVSPQVIIGAFGKARKLPRFDDEGNVIPANIMPISWSADHRIVDGVTVARFSNLWKYYVENPMHLLICP
ncbi:PREDICTED: lipoamide acyltransferase component of branched-chain alpha-keto acid dehydrogenase complex, mitochondrial [Trachymyrmex cornetzi]|nr:PREDICTED: lipoamide acyltransferase component of branched-chain alpha-keto acid dehydrogenase complex, mitochondrial [Trachymyrmex cornetzi]